MRWQAPMTILQYHASSDDVYSKVRCYGSFKHSCEIGTGYIST